jgi:hypothetical protein
MSVTKTVIYVRNEVSHILLKYRWCDRPIFLNVHTANKNKNDKLYSVSDKWIRVTTAWRVLSLRMEEQLPIWDLAANTLNKQSRTADNV